MTQPRRVLVVTPHYPPTHLGGTELRARKLAKGLIRLGIDAQVLCVESVTAGSSDGCALASGLHDGVRVHRLELTTSRGPQGFRLSFDNPFIEGAVDILIDEERIDLVHLISGYLVTACAIRSAHRGDLPAVVTLTDYWFLCPRIQLIRSTGDVCDGPHSALDCTRCLLGESRRYRWPERAMPAAVDLVWRAVDKVALLKRHLGMHPLVGERMDVLIDLLNAADAVTIPTNSLRPRLVRAGAVDRFILSRHSLDFDQVDFGKAIPKSPSPTFRFGYIGQIQHVKGIDLAVNAFRRLSSRHGGISLTIWGQTPASTGFGQKLASMVRALPGVQLCGRYEPGDLPAIMASIDALIVPSRWPEIGPFVILEAFATRTPVIAAAIGNMPELVDHSVNGLLFRPGDSADLEHQMERLLVDRTLHEQVLTGIPRVRSMQDEMSEILDVYSSVSNGREAVPQHAMP